MSSFIPCIDYGRSIYADILVQYCSCSWFRSVNWVISQLSWLCSHWHMTSIIGFDHHGDMNAINMNITTTQLPDGRSTVDTEDTGHSEQLSQCFIALTDIFLIISGETNGWTKLPSEFSPLYNRKVIMTTLISVIGLSRHACLLFGAKPCSNQCWLIVNCTHATNRNEFE